MAGRESIVNPAANDENSSRTSMMDLWRESVERSRKQRSAPSEVAQSAEESRADLEQKIRSGQAECPTCAARAYKDESGDGGVSFQAPRHIGGANAGVVVMNHEQEHVAEGSSKSNPEGGVVKNSTVGLEYKKCPECGKTYVAGGVTKTTSRPASYTQKYKKPGEIDTFA